MPIGACLSVSSLERGLQLAHEKLAGDLARMMRSAAQAMDWCEDRTLESSWHGVAAPNLLNTRWLRRRIMCPPLKLGTSSARRLTITRELGDKEHPGASQ